MSRSGKEPLPHDKQLSESIVSSLPGVFYLYDDQGRFLLWNENFETVSGYTGEEVSRMHPLDFFEGVDKSIIEEKIAEVFALGTACIEAEFLTKDGKRKPYYFNGQKIIYDGKHCLIGVGIDISDRVRAEESVTEWEKRFRNTLDNMLEGVQLFNDDWRCLYVNDMVAKQGPYTREQTYGRTLMENYPGIEHTELFKIFQECKDKNTRRHLEYEFTFPDGSTRWFELSIQPNPEGLLVLSIDIDERKKAEEVIRKSEEKYRYLFNNNPALIVIWDPETLRVIEINDQVEALYGYTREEYLQMTVLQYRPVDDHDKIREFAADLLKGQVQKFRGVWRHLKKNGEVMYMDITSHRIDYNGKVAVLSLAKDITDQYNAEEKLKKTYEDIRRLNNHLQTVREEERLIVAREIHDELGQQLTGLKMDISWLAKRTPDGDEQVRHKISDILSLIDDTVRTVRRISSDLRPGILDDLGLIAALEWQSGEFEKRSGIPISCSSSISEPVLAKDVAIGVFRVYQEALTNITRHAQATKVTTTLEQKGDDLILTVTDDGAGFDPDDVRNGNTLGLLGMNERAIMLGGGLYIDSTKGKGTTVILRIPMHTSNRQR